MSTYRDQVWFKLSIFPEYFFGACYIPPRDSPFFSPESFSTIQENIMDFDGKLVLLGDLNSRISDLNIFSQPRERIYYSRNVDSGNNVNGRDLSNLCINLNLKPVNHVKFYSRNFNGDLTYRQGERWVSQLDWVLVSTNVFNDITDYTIDQHCSFDSNHAALYLSLKIQSISYNYLYNRALFLGFYKDLAGFQNKKNLSMSGIDREKFVSKLPPTSSFWNIGDTYLYDTLTKTLYDICNSSFACSHNHNNHLTTNRWSNILYEKDSRKLWNAINWKGNFDVPHHNKERPSDIEFSLYFTNLLNPENGLEPLIVPNTNIYIPVLDDPILPDEVIEQFNHLKSNKACGIDGIPPGILKLLNDEWILLITYMYNVIFDGYYPDIWHISRMFVIFKKGSMTDAANYRGISILIALCKVYDSILNQRFIKWYKPEYEQAGCQVGRGCIEQILTLRLLIDSAKKKGRVLYIVFIDYVKAFDKVNRSTLLTMLARKGCSSKYLNALGKTLQTTKSRIGGEEFTSSIGVRQGGATSTSLFTFYIDPTIQALKQIGPDDFLGDLHSILLMDDTVVLATSRTMMKKKLEVLAQSAQSIGMEIHPNKSKYMVCNKFDIEPFVLGNVEIAHTNSYVYLGTPISVGTIDSQIELHVKGKQSHIRKFTSFLTKNSEAPFKVKKLVLSAALNSTLLYGAESWYSNNLQSVVHPILSATKQMLGVREQTCTDNVYIESGSVSPKAMIRETEVIFREN